MRLGVNAMAAFVGIAGMIAVACSPIAGASSGGTSSSGGSSSGGSSSSSGADAGEAGADEGDETIITDLAFVPSESGPRVLVRGKDAKRRLEGVRVRFLDAHGESARYDVDGDGIEEPDHVEVAAPSLERTASGFFLELQSAPHVDDFVKAIAVELDDGRAVPPAPRIAWLAALPLRGSGEACDPDGFDRCASETTCASTSGAWRCTSTDAARGAICASAPAILASGSGVVVSGRVAPGTSLFEPMAGCTNGLRMGRPEAVFRLVVDRSFGEMIVTTESEGTMLDTVVSVLDGCGNGARVLACNDDAPPPFSTVVLDDIAPGTYFVVVDSLARAGGTFELRVTAR